MFANRSGKEVFSCFWRMTSSSGDRTTFNSTGSAATLASSPPPPPPPLVSASAAAEGLMSFCQPLVTDGCIRGRCGVARVLRERRRVPGEWESGVVLAGLD